MMLIIKVGLFHLNWCGGQQYSQGGISSAYDITENPRSQLSCGSHLCHTWVTILIVHNELLNLGRKMTSFSAWTVEWHRSRFSVMNFFSQYTCPPCTRATRQLNLHGYDLNYHTGNSHALRKMCKDITVHRHTNHPSSLCRSLDVSVSRKWLPSSTSLSYFVWDRKQFFLIVHRSCIN